jgi:hypothetical protein
MLARNIRIEGDLIDQLFTGEAMLLVKHLAF